MKILSLLILCPLLLNAQPDSHLTQEKKKNIPEGLQRMIDEDEKETNLVWSIALMIFQSFAFFIQKRNNLTSEDVIDETASILKNVCQIKDVVATRSRLHPVYEFKPLTDHQLALLKEYLNQLLEEYANNCSQ